jgi:uncharacterized protein (DUF1800 family)
MSDAVAHTARARHRPPALPVPQRLHATSVAPTAVALAWRRVRGPRGRQVIYELLRNGRRIAALRHTGHFVDHGVQPNTTYRYRVRAHVGRRHGRLSRRLTVRTPGLPPPPPPPSTLTQAMVDRLFWRAGFGPSDADRKQWAGQPPGALVDHFMTAPYLLAPTTTPPTYSGNQIDPLATDQELQMEWLDRMQRTTNPLVERINLFWHRHFAVSRDAGIPAQFMLTYRDRLRRYSDFAANPTASFHDLAVEMTTQDAAMSLYLTGFLNQKKKPNENYAREFMELFTLGVTDERGNPNYSQTDVHELARAFTGYTLNQTTGAVAFNPSLHDTGPKTILGQTGPFDAAGAIAVVLAHPSHPRFIVRKLWGELIAAPIPADAEAALVGAYVSSGLQLAPLLRGILGHPLIFDSLAEPAMIKPPVVFTVGVLRALGAPLRDSWQTSALYNMQQQPYHPPNVAGWEGGLAWMNTGTSTARFDLIVRCQQLLPAVADVPHETPQEALARAYAACGSPWISAAAVSALLAYAQQAPTNTAARRRERQYALQAFILGGPEGQVM